MVELLIAIGLFGLISTSMALLIKYGFAYTRNAEDRAELQRSSLFVLNNLSREISETNPDCLRWAEGAEPPGLVFASPRGDSDQVDYENNHLVWKKWVCFYWDQEEKFLFRVEEPLASTTVFKPDPSPAGFDKSTLTFSSSTSPNRRIMARGVTDFQVTGHREVEISLRVEVGEGEHRSRLTTRTGVRPNN